MNLIVGLLLSAAIGLSLGVVGVTSLIGAALHSRRNNVRWRTGLLFGTSGVFGAFFGVRLTHLFSPSALLLLFAGLMIVVAALMLKKNPDENNANGTGHFSLGKAIVAGLGVGVLTGFLGVGGGFLIVPALALFGGLAIREAVGTSLVVIAINCAAGLVGQMQHGGGFDARMTIIVSAMAAIGMLAGAALSHNTSVQRLNKGFAYFVLAVAIFLIAKNYQVLMPLMQSVSGTFGK